MQCRRTCGSKNQILNSYWSVQSDCFWHLIYGSAPKTRRQQEPFAFKEILGKVSPSGLRNHKGKGKNTSVRT